MRNTRYFIALIDKYGKETASPEECEELMSMINSGEYQNLLEQHIGAMLESDDLPGTGLDEVKQRDILQKIYADIPVPAKVVPMKPRIVYIKWRVAAACILCLACGITYLWVSRQEHGSIVKSSLVPPVQADILPGGNRATLTLSDGAVIALDSARDGNVARQGAANVVKLEAGRLAYTVRSGTDDAAPFNLLSTPRGGQYQVVLPDGSQVWLNAASSLRFPTAFRGAERKVELTGEAYFEVKKNERMPFKVVLAGGMEVEVLGTGFDIMAYKEEETIRTTLFQGAVKVIPPAADSAGHLSHTDRTGIRLMPGQQAQVDEHGRVSVDLHSDTAMALAWKNGRFQFDDTGIKTIMNQLARWYDVDIAYREAMQDKKFTGKISRNVNVSSVLSMLEYAGVHFRVEGKKIMVLR